MGAKYKIARIPYFYDEKSVIVSTLNKAEALEHALFISAAFNEDYRKNK